MASIIDTTTLEKLVVLDFGSQYNQLITRRIREFGVYSELLPHTTTAEELKNMNVKGIIFSGGPMSVYDENSFSVDPEIFNLGIPILGICYGMQLMTYMLGGEVKPSKNREYGKAEISVTNRTADLFTSLEAEENVWMSHGDYV
ncbi:MAG: glutamine-hydrolyzing GMP synthase, partial [Alkalibacterium sp.]|nr:glutamine-hydrolyzing GMP synthase [Alkalibacterium sp.]